MQMCAEQDALISCEPIVTGIAVIENVLENPRIQKVAVDARDIAIRPNQWQSPQILKILFRKLTCLQAVLMVIRIPYPQGETLRTDRIMIAEQNDLEILADDP